MIAKSKLTALLITILFSISGNAEIKNIYQQILEDYDIHPPALKYGYPLWYEYDTVQPTAIIFLKKELDDLHKINKITYVAEPTKENAEIIFNFSGTRSYIPKFYIIPDSNLTYFEVSEFIELLTPDYLEVQILLVGKEGNYVQVISKDFSIIPGTPPSFGYRNDLYIMLNGRNEILIESEFTILDSISPEVEDFYLMAFSQNYSHGYPSRRQIDLKTIKSYLKSLAIMMEDDLRMSKQYEREGALYERNFYRKLLPIAEEFGPLNILEGGSIILKLQGRYRPIKDYYQLLDYVNKGVLGSRQKTSLRYFDLNYLDLFGSKNENYLGLIHAELPDLIYQQLHRYPNYPELSLQPRN